MKPAIRILLPLTITAALLLACRGFSSLPGLASQPPSPVAKTITLYEILRQYAQNQGWPQPAPQTCEELGSPQPPGTTCFQPFDLPYADGGGLGISHFEQYGTSGAYCYVGSTASIYTFRNTDPLGDDAGGELTSEAYRDVAVDHYTYQTPTYSVLIHRWYYQDLTFTINETAYGADCQAYYPNTQAFQFLIDLLEEGYVVQ